jgi:hypothetical protein
VIIRETVKQGTRVTFVLIVEDPCCPISVVGDFNGWNPRQHRLARQADGTQAASVTLPTGAIARFRYLTCDGRDLEEQHADAHDGRDYLILV